MESKVGMTARGPGPWMSLEIVNRTWCSYRQDRWAANKEIASYIPSKEIKNWWSDNWVQLPQWKVKIPCPVSRPESILGPKTCWWKWELQIIHVVISSDLHQNDRCSFILELWVRKWKIHRSFKDCWKQHLIWCYSREAKPQHDPC